jgi:hypothetical protein
LITSVDRLEVEQQALVVVAAKGKAKTKTVDKVVLVDDSQVHKVQRQPE